jgi:hypothetical protein
VGGARGVSNEGGNRSGGKIPGDEWLRGSRAGAHKRANDWPGIAEKQDLPLETAQFVPSRIAEAMAWSDPVVRDGECSFLSMIKVEGQDKVRFEKAKQDITKAAEELVQVSMSEADEIIGAYLKGLPPAKG